MLFIYDWLINTFDNNTVRCKKLAAIVSYRKYVARPFIRRKQVSINAEIYYVVVIFWHLCLPVFVWRRVVLHILDPKQLLRVSCILWCYNPKCYSIILQVWCTNYSGVKCYIPDMCFRNKIKKKKLFRNGRMGKEKLEHTLYYKKNCRHKPNIIMI